MKKTAPPIAALICGYDTPMIAFANQLTNAVIATALGLKIKKNIFSAIKDLWTIPWSGVTMNKVPYLPD